MAVACSDRLTSIISVHRTGWYRVSIDIAYRTIHQAIKGCTGNPAGSASKVG